MRHGDGMDRQVSAATDLDDPQLLARLEGAAHPEDDDALTLGLIVMDRTGRVVGYNAAESQRSGLSAARVVGRHFFTDVGPCTDNAVVAGRYAAAAARDEDLDASVDYVFTFHMRPTPVRLRLLAARGSDRQYLVVQDR